MKPVIDLLQSCEKDRTFALSIKFISNRIKISRQRINTPDSLEQPLRAFFSTLDGMQRAKAIQRPFSSFLCLKELHSGSSRKRRAREHKLNLRGGGFSPSTSISFSTTARFLSASDDVVTPPHPLFSHKEVDRGIFHIEEKFFDSWNRANVFYVVGSQRDLLIDTG